MAIILATIKLEPETTEKTNFLILKFFLLKYLLNNLIYFILLRKLVMIVQAFLKCRIDIDPVAEWILCRRCRFYPWLKRIIEKNNFIFSIHVLATWQIIHQVYWLRFFNWKYINLWSFCPFFFLFSFSSLLHPKPCSSTIIFLFIIIVVYIWL